MSSGTIAEGARRRLLAGCGRRRPQGDYRLEATRSRWSGRRRSRSTMSWPQVFACPARMLCNVRDGTRARRDTSAGHHPPPVEQAVQLGEGEGDGDLARAGRWAPGMVRGQVARAGHDGQAVGQPGRRGPVIGPAPRRGEDKLLGRHLRPHPGPPGVVDDHVGQAGLIPEPGDGPAQGVQPSHLVDRPGQAHGLTLLRRNDPSLDAVMPYSPSPQDGSILHHPTVIRRHRARRWRYSPTLSA